jgi:protein-tyrosine phosphatase
MQEEGAILFHCFAGKDRTGVGAGTILSLLGVRQADIVYDYLLTNTQRQETNHKMTTFCSVTRHDKGTTASLRTDYYRLMKPT